jgi:NAD(P) transhydrogenase subunit beta
VILAGLAVGSILGTVLAVRIQMTAMPQMVALLNGFGGAASTLVAGAALVEALAQGRAPSNQFTVATGASGLIGAVTFWGSLVAWAKLERSSRTAGALPGTSLPTSSCSASPGTRPGGRPR